MGYPHVGALQNVDDFEALAARDIANGFVTSGQEFPHVWPCVVDCMNVVVQHGKPRMTIDKRMRLASRGYPDGVESYNDLLDLEAEREEVGKLTLPCIWMFTRAVAILQTAGVEVLIGKFDLARVRRQHRRRARCREWPHNSRRSARPQPAAAAAAGGTHTLKPITIDHRTWWS